ncbi:MAG: SCP2 sterol-binding domain-containing protein [Sneathiella sp.]
MKSIEEYVSGIRSAVDANSLGGKTVRMDIDDLGSIYIDGTTVSTDKVAADCVLTAAHDTYEKLYTGTLDPAIAFGTGALRLTGEMAVALRMPAIFAKANG